MKRKLTTIFCADVHGYSSMMANNEQETFARLKRYRGVMDELFAAHGGNKVNTWGDAVIAEFSSVVEAVRCAVNIQDAINAENADLDPKDRMQFRIGINLGDVMEDNDDLYGDGVNLASRLESLAKPGGIMVSESVYNLTHKQLAIGFDFAGTQKVKDADEPIECYRVTMANDNYGPALDGENADKDERKERKEKPGKVENLVRGMSNTTSNGANRFLNWFPRQPRSVQIAAVMIGFFFTINLLFSGIASPWFIFPSIPFLLYILARRR